MIGYYSFNLVESLGILVFALGIVGFLTIPLNVLFIAISNELILLGIILLFIVQGTYTLDSSSHILVLVLLTVSAIEVALLIAFWVNHFKQR